MENSVSKEFEILSEIPQLLDLTNEFIRRFIDVLDPSSYADRQELFINLAITAPSMIASSIIDKVSGTLHIDREVVLKQFIDKVSLALKWVDYKKQ